MADISADRLNSCEHQRCRIRELENMVRYLVDKLGTMEEEIDRQDKEITQLQAQLENDGK